MQGMRATLLASIVVITVTGPAAAQENDFIGSGGRLPQTLSPHGFVPTGPAVPTGPTLSPSPVTPTPLAPRFPANNMAAPSNSMPSMPPDAALPGGGLPGGGLGTNLGYTIPPQNPALGTNLGYGM